jgi:8-oxo-dGTP diphosphatase
MGESPKVFVVILVIQEDKVLLGRLSEKWVRDGGQMYGAPGRDLKFQEPIGQAVKRIMKEEIDVEVTYYKIMSVNANYEYGNHYIGIGVVAEIQGEIKRLKPDDWETWEWFDLKEVPESLFPAARDTIRCYLENTVCIFE